MTTIANMLDKLEAHLPKVVVLLAATLLFPIRLVVVALLPEGASHSWHKLNKVWRFFRFY